MNIHNSTITLLKPDETTSNVNTEPANPKRRRRRKRRAGKNDKVVPLLLSNVNPILYNKEEVLNTNLTSNIVFNPFSTSSYVAMDCEMIGVGPRKISVLGRCSIVDWSGNILLDVFCRTEEKIIDYRTHVSGIRPKDLVGTNSADFGTIRNRVLTILQDKVLVGHGLANDLKILNYRHQGRLIRDTAFYPPLMRFGQQPEKLKQLVWTELGKIIQVDEHCSVVDARSAMEIYKRHQAGWEYDIHRRRASFPYIY